jgi:hypothetical protein
MGIYCTYVMQFIPQANLRFNYKETMNKGVEGPGTGKTLPRLQKQKYQQSKSYKSKTLPIFFSC